MNCVASFAKTGVVAKTFLVLSCHNRRGLPCRAVLRKGSRRASMFSSYTSPRAASNSFSFIASAFLQSDGLPFAEVLSEEEIEATFAEENVSFAQQEDDIYTPAVTLWAWLSQVLHAGVARSCVAAVSRVTVLCVMLGREPPSPDSGDYCRARAKLSEHVLQRLVYSAADALESRVPAEWLWLGRHVKMADGTTLLAP